MTPEKYWKNFNLNSELHISGAFLYNGLECLDKVEHFENEDEIFEVLYHLAVGLERLMKIAIVLIQHNDTIPQDQFESDLKTHDLRNLLERLKGNAKLNLATPHRKLLECLSQFYKRFRYDRFTLGSAQSENNEITEFKEFSQDGLSCKFEAHGIFRTYDPAPAKRYVGKIVGKITVQLYKVICDRATTINLYTYEIRDNSKAAKIFLSREFDFTAERIAAQEILLALLKSERPHKLNWLIDQLDPLEFDPEDFYELIEALLNERKRPDQTPLVQEFHNEIDSKRKRLELIKLLGEDLSKLYLDNEIEDES